MELKNLLEHGENPISLVIDRRPRTKTGELYSNLNVMMNDRDYYNFYEDRHKGCETTRIVQTLYEAIGVERIKSCADNFCHPFTDINLMDHLNAESNAGSITFIDDMRFERINRTYQTKPRRLLPYLFKKMYRFSVIHYQFGNDVYTTVFFGMPAVLRFVNEISRTVIDQYLANNMIVELTNFVNQLDILLRYFDPIQVHTMYEHDTAVISSKKTCSAIRKLLGVDVSSRLKGKQAPNAYLIIAHSIIDMYDRKIINAVSDIIASVSCNEQKSADLAKRLDLSTSTVIKALTDTINNAKNNANENKKDRRPLYEYIDPHTLSVIADHTQVTVSDLYKALAESVNIICDSEIRIIK